MAATQDYINTVNYQKMSTKLRDLVSIMSELATKNKASRNLRYVEVDVEAERGSGKLAPDELYIPQHIIDTNIRREQSSYVQYVTQSPRAVVLQDLDDPSVDTSVLEKDVSNKIRFDGWQLSMFANIDGFQQNGYGIMEVVFDPSQPGNVAHETVAYGDFGMALDTKDIQAQEMLGRNYYFSRTRLLAMCDENYKFSKEQVEKVVGTEPTLQDADVGTAKDRSLFMIQKVMFRVNGVVNVAWCSQEKGDDWIRAPRPLFIGRVEVIKNELGQVVPDPSNPQMPMVKKVYETNYPYFPFPYLISENNTLSQLKGRVFLDQDCQQAAASLVSSLCTSQRRGAGLYFSKDTDDPNDDLMLQKNVFFAVGALINKKVSQFQVKPASAVEVMGAVNAIVTQNQQETSQVNFAAMNRVDSRKTATEVSAATQAASALSTVQVVLFSNSLKQMYEVMFYIIRSRVLAGIIKTTPELQVRYSKNYVIRPSGDVDVIERQQLIQAMSQALPIMQQTPAGPEFMMDLISKMFPEKADKYIQILRQAMAQQQSVQAQQEQMMKQKAMEMAQGIVELSKNKNYFSEIGQIHAFPVIQQAANMIEQTQQQLTQQSGQQAP